MIQWIDSKKLVAANPAIRSPGLYLKLLNFRYPITSNNERIADMGANIPNEIGLNPSISFKGKFLRHLAVVFGVFKKKVSSLSIPKK